jgi:hypothetical protein
MIIQRDRYGTVRGADTNITRWRTANRATWRVRVKIQTGPANFGLALSIVRCPSGLLEPSAQGKEEWAVGNERPRRPIVGLRVVHVEPVIYVRVHNLATVPEACSA